MTAENTLTQIRMSGLGGQGVVTAAHLIGSSAVKDGKSALVNPFFGAEKRLAPAESYVRIADRTIYDKGEITYPNMIMIFHPHVITLGKCYTMPFYSGLKRNGVVIINTDEPLSFSKDDMNKFKELEARLYFVPATKIAREIATTEMATNIVMVGMLVGLTQVVSEKSVRESIEERFGAKKFIASGTTAALDDAIKNKYSKTEQLILSNFKAVEAAIKASRESKNLIEGDPQNVLQCFGQ
jgi:pyruvate ferredoxin oxidoreductase gamma subunit